MKASRRLDPAVAAALIPLVFLGTMVVWPLVAVFDRTLVGVGLERVTEVASRSDRVLWFTLGQALLSTIATLIVGLPIAQVLARYRFRGRSTLRAIAVVPFVLPTVVVAMAFDALIRDVGWFGDRPLLAIIAAHVFFNVAVVIRVVGGYWARLDDRQLAAARVLGAGPWTAFRLVTLRQLAPVLSAAGLLVFLFSFTSYGIILILGGISQATIETEIRRYALFRQEFDVAAVLALVQIIVVSIVAGLHSLVQRRFLTVVSRPPGSRQVDSARRRVHVAGVFILVFVVIGLPVLALIRGSLLVDDGWSLAHYRALSSRAGVLPVSPLRALATSLQFAIAAAVLASIVGYCTAKTIVRGGRLGRVLETAALIPLGVSAVTLGFGYLLAFTVLDLRRSIWLIPVAHAVIGLPFVLASVVPTLRSVDDRLRQVAATLGASPGAVRRSVEWPLVRPALLSGAGFAAAVSIGEFGATSFLSRSDDAFTAPLAVFRLLSRPGSGLRGQALALSVVIGFVVAALAATLEHRRGTSVSLL